MTSKNKANLAILTALLVLFSALVAPLVSAAIAIIALVAFAIYEYRSPD
jgi:integral membrane sensor domain MASE1